MTTVKLKPGTQEECADLFEKTNPDIVRHEPDWLGAQMIIDRETDVVIVLATWREVDAYRKMSSSPKFADTMAQFGQFFAAAPEISVNEVLVDMTV